MGAFSERTGGQVVATIVTLPWRRNRRARACTIDSGGESASARTTSFYKVRRERERKQRRRIRGSHFLACVAAWLACLRAYFDVGAIRASFWPVLLVAKNAESQGRRNSLSLVRPPARERGVSYSEAASEGIPKGIASIRSAGRRGLLPLPKQDGRTEECNRVVCRARNSPAALFRTFCGGGHS
jgi:hypothetical protein